MSACPMCLCPRETLIFFRFSMVNCGCSLVMSSQFSRVFHSEQWVCSSRSWCQFALCKIYPANEENSKERNWIFEEWFCCMVSFLWTGWRCRHRQIYFILYILHSTMDTGRWLTVRNQMLFMGTSRIMRSCENGAAVRRFVHTCAFFHLIKNCFSEVS